MIVICSSSDPQQLRALLATLDSTTFRGVISFGVAGGLDPSLKSGDVVVATEVLAGDTRFLAGLALNEELIARAALASPARGPRWPGRRRTGDCGDRLQGRAAFGDGRGSGRYGKSYCRSLCGQGRLAVRGAAGHLRSRQPGASGAGQERHQAERRHRPRQGAARGGAQSHLAARAGLHRNSISIARCAPCAAAAASCTAKRGSPPRRSDIRSAGDFRRASN